MALRDLISRNRTSDSPVPWGDRFERSLMSLREDINRLFQNFGDDGWPALSGGRFPSVDIVENEKSYKVTAELFGMEADDVEVTANEGGLVIQGEKKTEMEDKDKENNYLRREISYGAFRRLVPMPEIADIDAASASFANSVLTVEVPKKAEALRKSRKLTITKH